MKITYTKEETIILVEKHIADLLGVDVTNVTFNPYSEDFLCVTSITPPAEKTDSYM
jgi:hypothetical protein